MLKALLVGLVALTLSFYVGVAYVDAQETTPTPSPTETQEDDTPSGAPQTGFGG